MKGLSSERIRHIVLRAGAEDTLPEFFEREMREHAVLSGWLRASGVLTEVELRAYGADIGGHGVGRRIAGPVQAVMIEGSVGLADGDVSVGLRAVLARETDRGMETLAGEIVTARVVALEGVVTAFDDLAMPRALDADAAVWLFGVGGVKPAAPGDAAREPRGPTAAAPAPKAVSPAWSEAIAASALSAPAKPTPPRVTGPGAAIPIRPVRPSTGFDDGPFPEAGDIVEHFAFGTCEVLKSDGDRLHLKVYKDGRIREIALEMLKVSLLTTDGETQRYRLDRKL